MTRISNTNSSGQTSQKNISDPQREIDADHWPTSWNPTKSDSIIFFPDMTGFPADILESESLGHVRRIDVNIYDEINQRLPRYTLVKPFSLVQNANLPPIAAVDYFIQLYIEFFHPIFPLLHKPTFYPRTASWVLVLAVPVIRMRYSRVSYSSTGANSLTALLRRSILETVSAS
jgi:hypothetical protein